jgi:predicted RNase H-like HicB family nuclease
MSVAAAKPDTGLVTVCSTSDKLRLTITYDEPDEDGWIVARVLQVPGAISQGRTREEARENVIDALRLMLAPDDGDARAEAGRSEPLGLTLTE